MVYLIEKIETRTVIKGKKGTSFLQVHPDLAMLNLRIKKLDHGPFRQEVFDQGNRCRFARVACISFEGKAKDCNRL